MKILIVEDEAALTQSISEYLSGENYLCEAASTFSEAMSKIEIFDYDCILLDIMLPDGNGLDLLQEIKRQKKQNQWRYKCCLGNRRHTYSGDTSIVEEKEIQDPCFSGTRIRHTGRFQCR